MFFFYTARFLSTSRKSLGQKSRIVIDLRLQCTCSNARIHQIREKCLFSMIAFFSTWFQVGSVSVTLFQQFQGIFNLLRNQYSAEFKWSNNQQKWAKSWLLDCEDSINDNKSAFKQHSSYQLKILLHSRSGLRNVELVNFLDWFHNKLKAKPN